MAFSKRRSTERRQSGPPSNIGALPVPDIRAWPESVKEWFRNAVGEAGPLDVFLFDSGQVGSLYLQDAITAAAIVGIDISEWHVENGYPAFIFDAARIGEIRERLGAYGYAVHLMEPSGEKSAKRPSPQGLVVSISEGRNFRAQGSGDAQRSEKQ